MAMTKGKGKAKLKRGQRSSKVARGIKEPRDRHAQQKQQQQPQASGKGTDRSSGEGKGKCGGMVTGKGNTLTVNNERVRQHSG